MENFLHKIVLNKCYLCSDVGEVICINCFKKFNVIYQSNSVYNSIFEYNDIAKKVLYLSKYPPYYFYLLKFLIKKWFISNKDMTLDFDKNTLFCPVPLHSSKLYERGFNQAEIISETLSSIFEIPTINLFKRVKDTSPLYELSKFERSIELSKAFSLRFVTSLILNLGIKRVFLVDDLVTTRQTFLACSKLLNNYQNIEVRYLSLFSKKDFYRV